MINPQPKTSMFFADVIPPVSQFNVVTAANEIPPWEIIRAQNTHGLSDISVEAIDGYGNVIDLYALLDPADPMEIVTLSNATDVLIWKQSLQLTGYIPGGIYYVKVTDTVNTWYSRYWLQIGCFNVDVPPGYDWDLEVAIPI
jgi:hypothetical protein